MGFGWGPDGSSSLHVIFFPMFFQRSMSLLFRVGGGSYFSPCSFKDPCRVTGIEFGSPGSACELPRPHDDAAADDDDDVDAAVDDDDDDLLLMMMIIIMMMINVADLRCDSGQTMAWNRSYTPCFCKIWPCKAQAKYLEFRHLK